MLFAFAVAFSAYGEDVKECLQTCKQITQPCLDPCMKLKQSSARGRCRQQCDLISSTCKASCEQKRRIDPEFMKAELMKRMPKGGGGGQGGEKTIDLDESGFESGSSESTSP